MMAEGEVPAGIGGVDDAGCAWETYHGCQRHIQITSRQPNWPELGVPEDSTWSSAVNFALSVRRFLARGTHILIRLESWWGCVVVLSLGVALSGRSLRSRGRNRQHCWVSGPDFPISCLLPTRRRLARDDAKVYHILAGPFSTASTT